MVLQLKGRNMKFWTSMVLILSLSLAGIFSYYLYREFTARIEKTGVESIGTITFKKKSASRRYADTIVWENVEEEAEIYNYDAIRTLDYSAAVIKLKNGTAIELAENTMLIVVLDDRGVNINFDRGGISASTGGEGSVRLNSSDASVSLSDGDISVKRDNTGMDIQVNSGKAEVSASGEKISITSDMVLSVTDGKPELREGRLVPVFPENNGVILTFTGKAVFDLSWESDMEGDLKVELSRNRSFSPVLAVYSTGGKGVRVNPGEGNYYWRLVKGRTKSIPASFSVAADRKPRILSPHKNQKVVLVEGTEMVTFRWEKGIMPSLYEVIVAKDSKMSEQVLKLNSKVNTISTDKLKPGVYYWKVRSIYPEQVFSEAAESDQGRFTLEQSGFSLTKPVPLNQGPVTTAVAFRLSWTGVPGGRAYRIEMSRDKDFRSIVTAAESGNTFVYISEVPSPGEYYWRVGALKGDLVSAFSDTAVQEIVEPLAITLLYPLSGDVIFSGKENIRFSWKDPNEGSRYLFEMSEDNNFRTRKIVRESGFSSIDIKNPGAGHYFWRVILQGESGRMIARSSIQSFSVPVILKAPVPLSPENNERVVPAVKRKIRFEWERSSGADDYEVEIFRRTAGAEKSMSIFSSKTNNLEITNVSIFRPGNYSWVVRAKKLSGGRVAGFSESARYFFEVQESDILPPPVIKKPEIIFY